MPGVSSAPSGRIMSNHKRSHGLRDAESGVAPPVATIRRPVGAKNGSFRFQVPKPACLWRLGASA